MGPLATYTNNLILGLGPLRDYNTRQESSLKSSLKTGELTNTVIIVQNDISFRLIAVMKKKSHFMFVVKDYKMG